MKHSTVINLSACCTFALSFLVLSQATIGGNGNALTIKWYDNVTAEKVEPDPNRYSMKHLAEWTNSYTKVDSSMILQGTNFIWENPDSISWRPSHGFVDTVFYSYRNHHNLKIRPDDVWTAIIVQFSRYVNANAEALRHYFVKFDGKKTLSVEFYTPVDEIPINQFIERIVALIDENITPTITDWIAPNFTTTTENDKLTAGAALMSTLQKYFEYELLAIACGIPQVTILGAVDDWKEIRKRVERLKEFEVNGENVMTMWSTMLGQILDEFVRVKEGSETNEEFWRQAIRVDYSMIWRYEGCFNVPINETYLDGWLTAFSAFDEAGNWQRDRAKDTEKWIRISSDQITNGVVHVPIKIHDEFAKPGQRDYTGAIITGHMGYSVKMDEVTLQPLSGWAMTITGTPPDYLTENRKSQ